MNIDKDMDRYCAILTVMMYKFGLMPDLVDTLPISVDPKHLTDDDWHNWVLNQNWLQQYSYRAKMMRMLDPGKIVQCPR